MVTFSTAKAANSVIGHPLLKQRNLTADIPVEFAQCELEAEFESSAKILTLSRLNRKIKENDGTFKFVPFRTLMLKFEGQKLPKEGNPRCIRCAQTKHKADKVCPHQELPPICDNCGAEHLPTSLNCPALDKQKQIYNIAYSENIPLPQARARVEGGDLRRLISYRSLEDYPRLSSQSSPDSNSLPKSRWQGQSPNSYTNYNPYKYLTNTFDANCDNSYGGTYSEALRSHRGNTNFKDRQNIKVFTQRQNFQDGNPVLIDRDREQGSRERDHQYSQRQQALRDLHNSMLFAPNDFCVCSWLWYPVLELQGSGLLDPSVETIGLELEIANVRTVVLGVYRHFKPPVCQNTWRDLFSLAGFRDYFFLMGDINAPTEERPELIQQHSFKLINTDSPTYIPPPGVTPSLLDLVVTGRHSSGTWITRKCEISARFAYQTVATRFDSYVPRRFSTQNVSTPRRCLPTAGSSMDNVGPPPEYQVFHPSVFQLSLTIPDPRIIAYWNAALGNLLAPDGSRLPLTVPDPRLIAYWNAAGLRWIDAVGQGKWQMCIRDRSSPYRILERRWTSLDRCRRTSTRECRLLHTTVLNYALSPNNERILIACYPDRGIRATATSCRALSTIPPRDLYPYRRVVIHILVPFHSFCLFSSPVTAAVLNLRLITNRACGSQSTSYN
ncbi:hypothetical protein DBV15_11729 [Temnothorax longispinosus]|uniref:Endonuclease/exonuclease/phosphatase domain-containing protein n=1 Tax=Temnothorax longispinosus TaxID=300112 RepID=A0A4S2KF55_9HYME|nr:hypothetical protein DBV15_11729 [Temnothorax longispinosus]